MRLIDNINVLPRAAFKGSLKSCSKQKIAASCFSACAYVALKEELASASVCQENSPERIYFLMLYSIFKELIEDVSEDVLPNDRTGYQQSLINKLDTYSGCIPADNWLNYNRSLKTNLAVGEDGILRQWQHPGRLLRTRHRRRLRQARRPSNSRRLPS
jgi:hypothetical protein